MSLPLNTVVCAAAVEQMRWLGIELDPQHAKVAQARAEYWQAHGPSAASRRADEKQQTLASLFTDEVA